MPDAEIPKLYYSIGQVSRLTGLDPHVLRYWETEFHELSPRKNRGGKRLYRDSDIKLLLQIKELLYNRRFTIEGARRHLREQNGGVGRKNDLGDGVRGKFEEVRQALIELRGLLDG